MAWDVSGKPIGGQNGPIEAFHRLFAKDTTPIEQQKAMLAQKRSVLDNCPTILTGGGAGIKLGHNIVAPKDTPLCNAWLTLLNGIGIKAERHGDSSGVIKELIA